MAVTTIMRKMLRSCQMVICHLLSSQTIRKTHCKFAKLTLLSPGSVWLNSLINPFLWKNNCTQKYTGRVYVNVPTFRMTLPLLQRRWSSYRSELYNIRYLTVPSIAWVYWATYLLAYLLTYLLHGAVLLEKLTSKLCS